MKGLLISFCMLFALPALATEYNWPALYDVWDVAADDALNVRAAPEAGAEIVGTLASDAKNIEVVEVNDDLTWGLVNINEQSGWVSLRFMSRQPDQWYGSVPVIASCFGTEPFWTLTLGEDARWSSPEVSQALRVSPGQVSHNQLDRYSFHGESTGGSFVAIVGTAACTDWMSDRAYGMSADVLWADTATGERTFYSGCCTMAP